MTDRSLTARAASLVRHVRTRPSSDWLLLGRTTIVLAAASMAIALLPFRTVVRVASRVRPPSRGAAGEDGGRVDRYRWAVEAASRRVPWRTVCFQKGLTLHLMLRRSGVASLLHYGVGKDEKGDLAAHVWISVGGSIALGGEVVDRFRQLVVYPEGG